MAGNESLEWSGRFKPKSRVFFRFVAVLNQVHPTGASGRLEQRGDFFLGLMLADTPLRAGFALAATSDGKDSAEVRSPHKAAQKTDRETPLGFADAACIRGAPGVRCARGIGGIRVLRPLRPGSTCALAVR